MTTQKNDWRGCRGICENIFLREKDVRVLSERGYFWKYHLRASVEKLTRLRDVRAYKIRASGIARDLKRTMLKEDDARDLQMKMMMRDLKMISYEENLAQR